jgi:predicted ATP-grasp superfamily ATP-dependent carboligase
MSSWAPGPGSDVRVLIAGFSTRAAAESAARAGFHVTSIDAFADLDQHPNVRAVSISRDLGARPTPHAVTLAAEGTPSDAVTYLSPFENHPELVARLSRGRALWGNAPDTLRRARNPLAVMEALRRRGLVSPAVLLAPPSSRRVNDSNDPNDFLLKPLSSGGGQRVRLWQVGTRVPEGFYLQQRVRGTPASIVFLAAGGRAATLGVSRQIVGDAAFGVSGYRYAGNILVLPGSGGLGDDSTLRVNASALAESLAAEFDLVGVNGVDFIACGETPVAIEINPRWSASLELVERAIGRSMFEAHVEACVSRVLPADSFDSSRVGTVGKAIVFARTTSIVNDNRSWLEDPDVRDVPRVGEVIRAGHPVCTVFARAETASACYRALVERADGVYEVLSR